MLVFFCIFDLDFNETFGYFTIADFVFIGGKGFFRGFLTKKPLDTANIEEIDNYMSKDMSLAISSDPPNVSTRFFV